MQLIGRMYSNKLWTNAGTASYVAHHIGKRTHPLVFRYAVSPVTEMGMVLTTPRSQAHCSQHPGCILPKGLIGVFAALQTPLAAVCHATDIIKQQVIEGIVHHGVESKVALLHILLPQCRPWLVQLVRP